MTGRLDAALGDFDAAILGGGVAPGVEALLRRAAAEGPGAPAADEALARARMMAPEHPAVLIAVYRHHFYAHRLDDALQVAQDALSLALARLGLPGDWRQLDDSPLPGARDDVPTRFLLWLLKGYAYLCLRLARMAEARFALDKLRALDPEDRVGAALLETVRRRREAGAEEDEAVPVVTGAAAWRALPADGARQRGAER